MNVIDSQRTCPQCGDLIPVKQSCVKCVHRKYSEDRVCADCQKPYHGKLHGGKPQCNSCYRSPEAKQRTLERQRAKRAIVTSTCQECLSEFKGQGRKCSKCAYRARAKTRTCEDCGKSFHRDLFAGRSLCASCRLTENQRHDRANRSTSRRAILRGSFVGEQFSWRSFWAHGVRHCAYCGVECNPNDKLYGHIGPTYPTLDHVVPLVLGGEHTPTNGVLACFTCNSKKHTKVAAEYLEGG